MSNAVIIVNQVATTLFNSSGTEISPATEGTLQSIDGKDFATQTTLASIDGKDFATQTTLASLEAKDFATEGTLTSIDGKDFATQTTLAALEGKDFATQTTLASLEAKDFATQATLAALEALTTAIKDVDGIKKIDDGVQLQSGSNTFGKVIITDTAGNDADITPDGRFQVEAAPPAAPAGTTPFEGEAVSTFSGGNWTNFNLPTGVEFTIQQFIAGCEGEGGKGALCYIAFDQAGGQPRQNEEIIRAYTAASTFQAPVNFVVDTTIAGDRIRIRREALEGSTQEVYCKFIGYTTP